MRFVVSPPLLDLADLLVEGLQLLYAVALVAVDEQEVLHDLLRPGPGLALDLIRRQAQREVRVDVQHSLVVHVELGLHYAHEFAAADLDLVVNHDAHDLAEVAVPDRLREQAGVDDFEPLGVQVVNVLLDFVMQPRDAGLQAVDFGHVGSLNHVVVLLDDQLLLLEQRLLELGAVDLALRLEPLVD